MITSGPQTAGRSGRSGPAATAPDTADTAGTSDTAGTAGTAGTADTSGTATAPGDASPPDTATTARRGRPRNAEVDAAVIDTVLRLIDEGAAIGDLSMEGIAREAGVGKATVYRRWPGKDALMLDVLAAVEGPAPTATSRGVLRDDLIAAVEYLRQRSLAKRESALMRSMLTQVQGNTTLWRRYHDTVIAGRRRMLTDVLRHGIDTGQIRPELGADLELLADMVVGPVLARATLRPDAPLPESMPELVVDTLLHGMRPRD